MAEVSEYAALTGRKIMEMREEHRRNFGKTALMVRLLDYLMEYPVTTITHTHKSLNVTYAAARQAMGDLVLANILNEITGFQRNKIYRYQAFTQLFVEQAMPDGMNTPDQPLAPA